MPYMTGTKFSARQEMKPPSVSIPIAAPSIPWKTAGSAWSWATITCRLAAVSNSAATWLATTTTMIA
jgi:hypothetical protein